MDQFPRTEIGGVSVSRMVAGTNWFLGFSHQSSAKSRWIKQYQTVGSIAEVLEVFLHSGVDVTIAPPSELLSQAIAQAEQRVGRKMHLITTPNFDLTTEGPDFDSAARAFDRAAGDGATFCWPHQCVTDLLYDGLAGTIRHMDRLCTMMRQRELIPGLSTHTPQTILAADRTGLDVASYTAIYNASGFMMPIEIDWARDVIHKAAKPVTTIKPMAAGRVMPYVGLPFVWSTLRDCDLVAVGTINADEARELIEISLACLQRRPAEVELQTTRSKTDLIDK